MSMTTIFESEQAAAIAVKIRKSDIWNLELLGELCGLADMSDAWEAADGDTFESVAFAAAEKLGVEIA